jgi:hypothetical protein
MDDIKRQIRKIAILPWTKEQHLQSYDSQTIDSPDCKNRKDFIRRKARDVMKAESKTPDPVLPIEILRQQNKKEKSPYDRITRMDSEEDKLLIRGMENRPRNRRKLTDEAEDPNTDDPKANEVLDELDSMFHSTIRPRLGLRDRGRLSSPAEDSVPETTEQRCRRLSSRVHNHWWPLPFNPRPGVSEMGEPHAVSNAFIAKPQITS